MIKIRRLIRSIMESTTYVWVDVVYVRETPKAILIIFDGQKAWIPKVWIYYIKRNKGHYVIAIPPTVRQVAGEAISIKIADYNWAKKFA